MKKFNNVWKDIEEYIYNDKNSLVFLLADKYYGKTEMLNYLMQRDNNKYKFIIEYKSVQEEMSLVRICFLKVLATIYKEDTVRFYSAMKNNGCMTFGQKIQLKKTKSDDVGFIRKLKAIVADYELDKILNVINEMLTEKVNINYYVGCYQVFEGFGDDIEYMNGLNSGISFNFVIATRPYLGNRYKYINKFSQVKYFELVIKKLEPISFRIIQSNTYYKMPVYNKLLKENGIDFSSDTEKIRKIMIGSDYFIDLCD